MIRLHELEDWKCFLLALFTLQISDCRSHSTLSYPQVNVASLRGYFLYPVHNEIHCQNFLHSHTHRHGRFAGKSQTFKSRGALPWVSRGLRLSCAAIRVPAYVPSKCFYDRLIVVTHAIFFPGYRRYKTNRCSSS